MTPPTLAVEAATPLTVWRRSVLDPRGLGKENTPASITARWRWKESIRPVPSQSDPLKPFALDVVGADPGVGRQPSGDDLLGQGAEDEVQGSTTAGEPSGGADFRVR